MAKNWKFGEAVRAIQAGNKEDIMDLGRRFPLFSNLAAQVNEAGMALIDCVPDYCTARKIESVLKGDVQEVAEDDATEEEAPAKEAKKAPAKKEAPKKAAPKAKKVEEEDDEDELEGKSAKELFEMCKEAGLKVKPKQDKSVYIEALKAANEEEDEDDWEDEEEEETPKKPAKKAPAKKAPAKKAADDEDDDWEV